jgi:hypothetical protein
LVYSLSISNVEILVALPDGEGSGPWEEFMAEDFCDEDVLGHVLGFKAVAADSGEGASQVAWFPGKGEGAESSRNVFGELRAGGGVDGVWGGEAFEGDDDLFWLGQNRDGVRFEAGAGSVAGFELALEDEGWEGDFFFGRLKEALKKISAGRRPVRAIRAMPFSR